MKPDQLKKTGELRSASGGKPAKTVSGKCYKTSQELQKCPNWAKKNDQVYPGGKSTPDSFSEDHPHLDNKRDDEKSIWSYLFE